jgi:hypothetical protein
MVAEVVRGLGLIVEAVVVVIAHRRPQVLALLTLQRGIEVQDLDQRLGGKEV